MSANKSPKLTTDHLAASGSNPQEICVILRSAVESVISQPATENVVANRHSPRRFSRREYCGCGTCLRTEATGCRSIFVLHRNPCDWRSEVAGTAQNPERQSCSGCSMVANAARRGNQFCSGCDVSALADSPAGGRPPALVCDLLSDRWKSDDCVAI